MAVSKVFYLLRPRFVAISDSYVRLCLGVLDARIAEPLNSGAFCAIRMERVLRGMRELGLQNVDALDELHAFSNQHAISHANKPQHLAAHGPSTARTANPDANRSGC